MLPSQWNGSPRQVRERIAVLDVDYHHGNGTQQIFYDRGDILYTSIHADPTRTFPYFAGHANETGMDAGAGTTFNQPLPAGTTDVQYLEAVDSALARIQAFRPAVVVVSLGFDTYGQDPIGDFALTTPVYHEVGRRSGALEIPLVIIQEGGYDIGSLGRNAREWLRGAAGSPRPSPLRTSRRRSPRECRRSRPRRRRYD